MSDTTSIESRAVDIISIHLSYCDHLIAYLGKQEKTRNYDGNVFLYDKPGHDQKDYIGKAAVQIKGRTKKDKDLLKEEIKFSVTKTKLNSYLQDGGVIYFVVYFHKTACSIYYANLLPYDLVFYLSNQNNKRSCSITLKRFPLDDTTEITNIFFHYVENQKRQASYKKPITIEDLEKQDVEIDSISMFVHGIGINKNSMLDYMATHDNYLYANIKGIDGYLIPIEKTASGYVDARMDLPIKINDQKYYDHYIIQHSKKGKTIKIGNSFFIKILDNNTINYSYKLSGSLRERIEDASFIIDYFESGCLTIGETVLPLEFNQDHEDFIEKIKKILKDLTEIKHMLEYLGVQKDFEISQATDSDMMLVYTLVKAILYNKPVQLSNIDPTSPMTYAKVQFGNIAILLMYIKLDDNKYKVENYFKLSSVHSFTIAKADNPQEKFAASHFLIPKKEDLLKTDNIDYHEIYKSIINIPPSAFYYENVNLFLLDILNTYDETENDALYNLANSIALWLKKENTTLGETITTTNYLQIIKRQRKLNIEEQVELFDLSKNTDDPRLLCGLYILLEEFEKAEACFSELTEEIQKEFKTYPIYNLWKPKKDIER